MEETILGVKVNGYSYDELMHRCKQRIESNLKTTIIAVNPEKVMKSRTDHELKDLINNSTYKIPDGVGILLASKLGENKINTRVTGIDMMDRVLDLASHNGYKTYFYGAKPEIIEGAVSKVQDKFPELNVAGFQDGYIQDEEVLIQDINNSGADILFVALGSPKQEFWIRKNMHKLETVKLFQGVGGSFDVYSGNVKRAPKFFRKTGLEWLYRLIMDPRRLKRQLALPRFLFKVLLNKQGRRK